MFAIEDGKFVKNYNSPFVVTARCSCDGVEKSHGPDSARTFMVRVRRAGIYPGGTDDYGNSYELLIGTNLVKGPSLDVELL